MFDNDGDFFSRIGEVGAHIAHRLLNVSVSDMVGHARIMVLTLGTSKPSEFPPAYRVDLRDASILTEHLRAL